MNDIAEQMNKEKQWESCGYITVSKSGKVLSVVVKHQRYVANLEELNQVLVGIREYTLIFEHKVAIASNSNKKAR